MLYVLFCFLTRAPACVLIHTVLLCCLLFCCVGCLAEIKSPPFEVTEMGWGEFEAKMTMHFKDPNEKPVDILHQLRLYHDAAAGTTQPKKASNERASPLTCRGCLMILVCIVSL